MVITWHHVDYCFYYLVLQQPQSYLGCWIPLISPLRGGMKTTCHFLISGADLEFVVIIEQLFIILCEHYVQTLTYDVYSQSSSGARCGVYASTS